MATVDVSIVGNGILGLMTAFELTNKDPSLKIAVIGPSDRKGGASQASGAMLGCFGEITDQTFFNDQAEKRFMMAYDCLLYTSPSPRDRTRSRMPSSA